MTDNNFQHIITKPDNVPIVLLIFSVGFFTWLGLRQAVVNDDRLRPRRTADGKDSKTTRCWSGPTWSTPS